MRKIFMIEMKRAVNIGCLIGIIGVVFSICFDSWNDLMRGLASHTGSVHYIFWNSSWGGVCRTYLLPIFAAIPFASSFCREYNSHMLPFIISREGKKEYCIAKYTANALSGGLTVAVGTGVLFAVLALIFPIPDPSYESAVVYDRFHAWIAMYHPVEYGVVEVLSGFFRGVVWSSVALCVSVYIPDPLVVVTSPYLISFIVIQMYRVLRIEDDYRLDKLVTGNVIIESSIHTLGICAVATLIIVCLLGVLFKKRVLRRLENDIFG